MQEALEDLPNEDPKEITFSIGKDTFSFMEIMMMVAGENEDAKMCVEAMDEESMAEFLLLKKDFELPENKENIARILEGQNRQFRAESAYMRKLHNESRFGIKKKRDLANKSRIIKSNTKARKRSRANKKANRK